MMIGIGTPSSQRRIPLPMIRLLYVSGGENAEQSSELAEDHLGVPPFYPN
jgi:hypothetical protein